VLVLRQVISSVFIGALIRASRDTSSIPQRINLWCSQIKKGDSLFQTELRTALSEIVAFHRQG
jgi:hypothetical protein